MIIKNRHSITTAFKVVVYGDSLDWKDYGVDSIYKSVVDNKHLGNGVLRKALSEKRIEKAKLLFLWQSRKIQGIVSNDEMR